MVDSLKTILRKDYTYCRFTITTSYSEKTYCKIVLLQPILWQPVNIYMKYIYESDKGCDIAQ